LNFATRDFLGFYDSTGQHVRTLKGASEDDSISRNLAVRALSLNTRPASVRALVRATEHPDASTASWAAWALGRHASMPYASRLIEPLALAAGREEPEVQREAILSLARMQHRPIRGQLVDLLSSQLAQETPADLRLIWGLGYLQHLDGLDVLTRALDKGDEGGVGAMAAWAMAQLRDQRGGRQVVPILEQRLLRAPFKTACAMIHALSVLGDERSNMVLMRAFDERRPMIRAQTCPVIEIATSPDLMDDPRILVRAETFAMKILQALGRVRATSAEMRALVEPWLETQIDDTAGNSLATRQAAENLLEGIRTERDDIHPDTPSN
ncbi:MAG: HEAT repeat domain-containing protein, partial [Nannocystaceae bacterium]